MKRHGLRNILRTLAKILFPLVFGVLFWFIFSEPDDELSVDISAFGILLGLVIGLAPIVYYPNNQKMTFKWKVICSCGFGVAIASVFIPNTIVLIIEISKCFSWFIWVFMSSVGSTLLVYLLLSFGINKTFKRNNNGRHIVWQWIITFGRFLFRGLLLLDLLCFVFIIINAVNMITDDRIDAMVCYGGGFLLLILSIWIVVKGIRDFYFLIYDKKEYILYLRSFAFDKNEGEILPFIRRVGIPVMKIGNPKLLFPDGNTEVFFLPSANWKKQLDYYISRAKYVFSVVDTTQGVLWEMFEHLEQTAKFIYFVHHYSTLDSMFTEELNSKYSKTTLWWCLNHIKQMGRDKVAFCIKEDKCYYGKAKDIIRLVCDNNYCGIEYITIPAAYIGCFGEKEDFAPSFALRMDVVRKTSMLSKSILKSILTYAGTLLAIIFNGFMFISQYVLLPLFYLALSLYAIILIISPYIDVTKVFAITEDAVFLDYPNWAKSIIGGSFLFFTIRKIVKKLTMWKDTNNESNNHKKN